MISRPRTEDSQDGGFYGILTSGLCRFKFMMREAASRMCRETYRTAGSGRDIGVAGADDLLKLVIIS